MALAVWLPSVRSPHAEVKRLYAADSFWNIPIAPSAEIDANSDAEVSASFARYASRAGFSNGAFGIPMAYASSGDKVYSIACTGDAEQCNGRNTFRFPIPAGSKPATGSDRHLSVIYPAQDGSAYAGEYTVGCSACKAALPRPRTTRDSPPAELISTPMET